MDINGTGRGRGRGLMSFLDMVLMEGGEVVLLKDRLTSKSHQFLLNVT